jgi:hypothetical protein
MALLARLILALILYKVIYMLFIGVWGWQWVKDR